MKRFALIVGALIFASFAEAQTILTTALKDAKEHNQLILLNFSGSDWCIPCIKMRKSIFEDPYFKGMSDSFLVKINADFPRNKKNLPSKDIQKQNDELAEKFNPSGVFPFTLLLNSDGKVIKSWAGLPKSDATSFTDEIRTVYSKSK